MALEVMGMEPSLFTVWVGAAGCTGMGFWMGRRWVWPGVVFLAWDLLSLWAAHGDMTDRFVGPEIVREAGAGYVTQTYVAHAIAIAAAVIGLAWGMVRWWRRRGESRESAAPSVVPVN